VTAQSKQAESRDVRAVKRRTYLRVVPLAVFGVMGMASIQLGIVLGVALRPGVFVTPLLVGLLFGSMLSRIIVARAVERFYTDELARREKHISQLNVELEQRVQQRTAELEVKTAALVQAQKMETMGRIAGGVAHDMNNILMVVFAVADQLQRQLRCCDAKGRPVCDTLLVDLNAAAERARGLTRQLLSLSHARTVAAPTDLRAVVEASVRLFERMLPAEIAVRHELSDEACHVMVGRTELEQLLLNLAVNARDAMPTGGTLQFAVRREGGDVLLRVSDTGVGMDAATRARAFEPFFTTKQAGKGTGLGLVIVSEIARRAAGEIALRSEPGEGTTFELRFPRCEAPAEGVQGSPSASAPLTTRATILLVEDDAAVRSQLAASLAGAGHRVLEATDGRAADALWLARGGEVNVIVCDVVLPGESGPSFVRRLRAAGTKLPVIFVSGYSEEEMDGHGGIDGARLLMKPFAPSALLLEVEQAMHRPAP
jgi:two-component system, cell cycle sensor histidine kinase and response regulator CckA